MVTDRPAKGSEEKMDEKATYQLLVSLPICSARHFHFIAQPMGLVRGDCTGRPANKLLTASSTYRR